MKKIAVGVVAKKSAGLIGYRVKNLKLQVFLVHPGGPFWRNKDEGAWSIPKGEYSDNEDPLEAAKREFKEETGYEVTGNLVALSPVKQAGGKKVHAWAVEGDYDADKIVSSVFVMEWPPRSGKLEKFPEVDRAQWFFLEEAKKKILKSQTPLLEDLCKKIGISE
ncbi:MAG: NUDIX domain-containing protein [Syntrophales bacterium]|nr:NUDIX domain-containing protein [Syntrophales bacterium]MDY0044891.1 NUDIX domain-containing protein [Syntrophales bacterium]